MYVRITYAMYWEYGGCHVERTHNGAGSNRKPRESTRLGFQVGPSCNKGEDRDPLQLVQEDQRQGVLTNGPGLRSCGRGRGGVGVGVGLGKGVGRGVPEFHLSSRHNKGK